MATRRVIVQELVSVDGFVADPTGGLEFILGSGRSLIAEDIGRRDLTLLEAKSYASGIVSLRYAVTRS